MNKRQLQFLESVANVKVALQQSQGWSPNTRQAEDICSCLRQGRLFLEASANAPLEIKPLQLYYGVAALAKALVLGVKRSRYLSTLPQSHGVKDTSPDNATLETLQVKVQGRGTFFEFNDVVAARNRLVHIRQDTSMHTDILPTANSQSLEGLTFTLRDLVSRFPGLGPLYSRTFGEPSNSETVHLMPANQAGQTERSLIINDDSSFNSQDELRALVAALRVKFPFLRVWTLQTAQRLWNKSHLTFINATYQGDDVGAGPFTPGLNYFRSAWQPSRQAYFSDVAVNLDPPAGGFLSSSSFFAVSPFEGRVISEFPVQFLVMHLLSSLVRYRPSIWMHALSRAATHERRADDRSLALIEQLMDLVDHSFPSMVCNYLSPER